MSSVPSDTQEELAGQVESGLSCVAHAAERAGT